MAVVNLLPASAQNVGGNWTVTGGGTTTTAVQTYDAGSNYIQIRNDLYQERARYNMDTMPATDGSNITQANRVHKIYNGRNTSGSGNYRSNTLHSSTNYNSSNTNFKVSWTEDSQTTGPANLTESQINSAAFGIQSRGDASPSTKRGRVERFMMEITYTPAAGLQVIAWALPLIGSAVALMPIVALARAWEVGHWQSNIRYTPEEIERLYTDLGDSRRAYGFMGEQAWQSM